MKKFVGILFLVFFFFLLFLATISTTAHAQAVPTPCLNPNQPCGQVPTYTPIPTPTTDPDAQGQVLEDLANPSGSTLSLKPAPENIEETTPSVEVTFRGLTAGGNQDWWLCTGDKDCLLVAQSNTSGQRVALPTQFFFDDAKIINVGKSSGDGTLKFTVCGDGSTRLKIQGCANTGRNWFHGGNMYTFSIGHKQGDFFIPINVGGFYVARSYPTLTIDPLKGITTKTAISVTIANKDRPRNGGDVRNNYQVQMGGGEGYSQGACVTLRGGSGEATKVIFNPPGGLFSQGTYYINIREQIDESTASNLIQQADVPGVGNIPAPNPYGAAREFSKLATNLGPNCVGGFTYYRVKCTITNQGATPAGTCNYDPKNPDKAKDPDGSEYKAFLKAINEINKASGIYSLPCGKGAENKIARSSAPCPEVQTAIGPIKVGSPQEFIYSIFQYTLAIAAFGGVILIMVSGYIMMTSQGDKEKVAGARETITAAIVGLLFIILSIVILEIIGVDILRIPGFGR